MHWQLSRKSAFVILTFATVVTMATASAPSPIYPIYQERWHFSVTVLTLVFAVYVVGLLVALLTVGSLSDHLGRRPILVVAFILAAISTMLFWTADGPVALIFARLVQGLASGTAMSALAAGLLDFAPSNRVTLGTTSTAVGTSVGMAMGAGSVGLLTQWTPHPDFYVFPVLTWVFLTLAGASLLLPEEIARRRLTFSVLRPKIRLAPEARSEFWASAPSTVAGWACTGLFLGLVPSLSHDIFHLDFGSAGGFTIAFLYIAVTAGGMWAGRCRARSAAILGGTSLTAGTAALAIALSSTSVPVFAAGSLAVGLGVGLTFNGNLRAIGAVTVPQKRSETFAVVYVLSYLSLSIPVFAAGITAPSWGLEVASYAYIGFVGVLSVAAFVSALARQTDRQKNDTPALDGQHTGQP
jgi:predicted MFS family arabinose efflux permease